MNNEEPLESFSKVITRIALIILIVGSVFMGVMISLYFSNINKIRATVLNATESTKYMEDRLDTYHDILKARGDSLHIEKQRMRKIKAERDSLLRKSKAQDHWIRSLQRRLKE